MNAGKTLFAQLMEFVPWSTASLASSNAMAATLERDAWRAPSSFA